MRLFVLPVVVFAVVAVAYGKSTEVADLKEESKTPASPATGREKQMLRAHEERVGMSRAKLSFGLPGIAARSSKLQMKKSASSAMKRADKERKFFKTWASEDEVLLRIGKSTKRDDSRIHRDEILEPSRLYRKQVRKIAEFEKSRREHDAMMERLMEQWLADVKMPLEVRSQLDFANNPYLSQRVFATYINKLKTQLTPKLKNHLAANTSPESIAKEDIGAEGSKLYKIYKGLYDVRPKITLGM